jgi:hypothetical protein
MVSGQNLYSGRRRGSAVIIGAVVVELASRVASEFYSCQGGQDGVHLEQATVDLTYMQNPLQR